MAVNLSYSKPRISLSSKPFCNFRVSKAYLWGLVHEKLLELLPKFSGEPLCLDAACHSLITRNIFPQKYRYYGLDIAKSRLLAGLPKSKNNDVFFLADLVKPISLNNAFDVVVSLNTLSHLSSESQLLALNNLIDSVKPGGYLFFNTTIDRNTCALMHLVSNHFQTIEPVYYHSFASDCQEIRGKINSSNVIDLMPKLEFSYPNDACFHREVLFQAKCSLNTGVSDISHFSMGPRQKIYQLNEVPKVSVSSFDDDLSYLNSFTTRRSDTCVVMTSRLASSEQGLILLDHFNSISQDTQILSSIFSSPALYSQIHVVGLESGWSNDEYQDRIFLNKLKDKGLHEFVFILVGRRSGRICRPSSIAFDI